MTGVPIESLISRTLYNFWASTFTDIAVKDLVGKASDSFIWTYTLTVDVIKELWFRTGWSWCRTFTLTGFKVKSLISRTLYNFWASTFTDIAVKDLVGKASDSFIWTYTLTVDVIKELWFRTSWSRCRAFTLAGFKVKSLISRTLYNFWASTLTDTSVKDLIGKAPSTFIWALALTVDVIKELWFRTGWSWCRTFTLTGFAVKLLVSRTIEHSRASALALLVIKNLGRTALLAIRT